MTYAFVQDCKNDTGTAVSSINAPSITVTSGDLLIAVIESGAVQSSLTVSGNSNSYNQIGVVTDGSVHWYYLYYAQGCNPGATVVNAAGTNHLFRMYVAEYSGISATSAFINWNGQNQNGVSTGANALSSGNVNVASQPALLWGFTANASNNTATLSAGTSPTVFTARTGNQWNSGPESYAEDARITSTGNVAATIGTNAFINAYTMGAAFLETFVPGSYFLPTEVEM